MQTKIATLAAIIIVAIAAGFGIWYFGTSDKPTNTSTTSNTKIATQESVTNPTTNTTVAGSTDVPTECPSSFVVEQTEGPYYTAGSPERTNIVESGTAGEPLTVTGYVFDRECNSIAGAWLDFWQADGNGNYDNSGYRLRGHQLTDENGRYVLQTVKPGEYSTRTPHIHVKIAPTEGGSVTTSQLYFPDAGANTTDSIYNAAQLVTYDTDDPSIAYFNFKLNVE